MIRNLCILTILFLYSIHGNAQLTSEDSAAIRARKGYFSATDSLMSLKFEAEKNQFLEKQAAYYQKNKPANLDITKEFSGLFYPEPDYALYNFRYKIGERGEQSFKLRLSIKMDDIPDSIYFTKIKDYDTIHCGQFVIKIPIKYFNKKLALHGVDIKGNTMLLDEFTPNYNQKGLLQLSSDYYEKVADHISLKTESFEEFVLRPLSTENSVERLIYTQNQFNIFPPSSLVGSSTEKNAIEEKEPINPCDSNFILEWAKKYQMSIIDLRQMNAFDIIKCLGSNHRFSAMLDNYIRTVLPTWKMWKDTCYKKRSIEPRADELTCNCQRISKIYDKVNNGGYFGPGSYVYSQSNQLINSTEFGRGRDFEYWDGHDAKADFMGTVWGPSQWLHLNSYGSCTPSYEGPTKSQGVENATGSGAAAVVNWKSPLASSIDISYSCENHRFDDGSSWPDSCSCPLDVNGYMYLEAELKTKADPISNCPWTTRSFARVLNMGLGTLRSRTFTNNNDSLPSDWGIIPKNKDFFKFYTRAASAQSSYTSSFSLDFFFNTLITAGWVFLTSQTPYLSPFIAGLVKTQWQNTDPIFHATSTGSIQKNEVLVDKHWKLNLTPNVPIQATLYNFYELQSKGQDGWNSSAILYNRFVNAIYINPNIPFPNESEYCCNDFLALWNQSGGGGIWDNTTASITQNYINTSTTYGSMLNLQPHQIADAIEAPMGCALFRYEHNYKMAKENTKNWVRVQKNQVVWNKNNAAPLRVELIDIMGKTLYAHDLKPQKDWTFINLDSYAQQLFFVRIIEGKNIEIYKILKQ